MTQRRALVGSVAMILALAMPGHAQQPTPQRAAGVVNQGVTAVLVDVVVRDRRGQPVRDLTQADFQVLEEGVPQTIGSFSTVFDGGTVPAPEAPAPPTPPATSGASAAVPAAPATSQPITAIVFDRLSPEARRLAVQAAQGYLGTKDETSGYIGIFGIDIALTPYTPFTRNARVLRQALTKMSSRGSASFNSPEQQQQKANADRQAGAAGGAAAAAESAGGPGAGAAVGGAPGEAMLGQMQSNMIKDFEVMEHDQQGYSTTNGLFAIISTLRRLPGRKSLILFSEGIAIPPAVQRLFLGVIDAANRANVSIYTMDAAGLRAESEQAKIRDQVNAAGGAGGGILSGGGGGGDPLSKQLEKNEEVLRQDPHNGLAGLSQDTGGLLFENTNNLRQGFDRVESDLRNYYLVGYTPTNETYDGRFRNIEVKVTRPGVTVAARKGYFAVRDAGGSPINAWEAPALGALETKPVPNAFPVRAGALLFPERARPGLVPVVVELKTAPITFEPAADGKTYTSDFAVLVRFLDPQNQVVRKVSQHYEVKGPIADLERAKQGDVIFYREPELAPGVYTMETVVYDALAGKSTVRISTVEVPKTDPARLVMSSLVLVKRGEKIPAKDRRPENPLLVNDVVLYPNLGETVSKAAKEVGFYFAAYPAPGGPAPEASIELVLDGKLVAQLPLPLAAADAAGRIQQAGRLPLAQLAPGTYDLRAVVKQGTEQVFRSTMLRIVE
jgi:VWFA-related protein